jgi:ParB family chromosome partitioning protein
MLELYINQIQPNSDQPRTRFDDNRLEELARSIRNNGIVQPLLVRRIGDRFELVAGERRWRAAQKAGLEKVPVVVRNVSDDKMLELALIENIQRQELNPIEEAYAYKRLIEKMGLTQEMLAQRVGKDRSVIANYIRLLRLPEEVQRLVEEDQLSMGHARALLGVEEMEVQSKVARSIVEGGLSVRETERAIKKIVSGISPAIAASKQIVVSDANVRNAETKLKRRYNTQVRIKPNNEGKGGRIEIEYYNDDDLDRIYQLLMPKNGADQ